MSAGMHTLRIQNHSRSRSALTCCTQRVVWTIVTTLLPENMAVGMPVSARLLVCLLLACLASVTLADTFGTSSAASGLLHAEDAACATPAMRKLLQQTSSQPPALPAQEVPFAVRQTIIVMLAF